MRAQSCKGGRGINCQSFSRGLYIRWGGCGLTFGQNLASQSHGTFAKHTLFLEKAEKMEGLFEIKLDRLYVCEIGYTNFVLCCCVSNLVPAVNLSDSILTLFSPPNKSHLAHATKPSRDTRMKEHFFHRRRKGESV